MERTMTVEERIRRAEEIYERRKRNEGLTVVHDEKDKKEKHEKKDVKLLRKMFIQLLVCICIYLVIYTIQNQQYIFLKLVCTCSRYLLDFLNKLYANFLYIFYFLYKKSLTYKSFHNQ